ncbi:MAG TPA: bifunctional serine/threonine-protein kinase/formylglycine-generating enzyme family protein, partial [Polyangium sp.]|nr:bifunctional serine/threonine-protein kinase/formylglycine-generating enzyme family protein [Polyangium sp.]
IIGDDSLAVTDVPQTEIDVPAVSARFAPGTKLGVYRIESLLGVGGMGAVYSAWDEVRGRNVAVKCLHPNLVADPDVKRRFLREARALRVFQHPGAAAIYDFLQVRDVLGIVMERIDGITLTRYIAKWRNRVPWPEIHAIFGAMLDAMAEAHAAGIVHRDLKPDNVLVRSEGGNIHVKLVDFGIAKIREGTTFTVTGAFIGTCRYMAPEQVKTPQLADIRSDVYSLGVTLYELCTGRVPFDYGNHFAVMMAQVQDPPAPPSLVRGDIPEPLEALILRALAKSPAERPATCRIFREAFDTALAGSIPPPEPPEPRHVRSAIVRDTDGYEMVLVPPGPFLMGPDRRQVFIDAYYIDRTPVTNEQFLTFVKTTGYAPEDEGRSRFLMHLRDAAAVRKLAKHPVVFVSWNDARAYASWAGKRLLTEAEWEKAARGTDGRRYPWGREEPTKNRALFGNRDGKTVPVGSFPRGASPFGVLDMAGNVLEWCEDTDAPDFYAHGPDRNPRNAGDKDSSTRVMRGGSFMHGAASLRVTSRTIFEPQYRFASGGFRCARSA